MSKSYQISEELLFMLLRFHLVEFDTLDADELLKSNQKISVLLNEKLDKMVSHELYTKYKTSDSQEEKEKARLEYLERKGIMESFRW